MRRSRLGGVLTTKILFVDDEKEFENIVKLYVGKNKDFDIKFIQSAREALDTLKEDEFDVVVSDYSMPGMSGIEFLKKLRSNGNKIPFILFTGRGREDVAIEALNSGADFYIQKSGDPRSLFADLTNMIKKSVSRKRSEDMINYQAHLLRNVNDAIIATDPEYIIEFWNDVAEKLYGWNASEVIGKPITDLLKTEYVYRPREEIITMLQKEGVAIAELRQTRKDGSKIEIEARVVAVRDDKGIINSYITVNRDITEKKKVLDDLAKSEDNFARIFRHAPEIMAVATVEGGQLVDVNDAFLRVTEFGRDEVLGKNPRDLGILSEEDEKRIISELREKKRIRASEVIFHTKSGKKRTIAFSADTIAFDEGICFLASGTDISERADEERIIRTSEELYRSIFESTGTAMVIIGENDLIKRINDESETLVGYSKSEVENNMKWSDFVAEEDIARLGEYRRLRMTTPDSAPRNYEFRLIDRSGEIRSVLATVTLIPGAFDTLVSLVDVTEHKNLNAQLERYAFELKERLKELSCILCVSDVSGMDELSLDEILSRIVNDIPLGWQYPSITRTRITIRDKIFEKEGFVETAWMQKEDIIILDESIGTIEIVYLEEKPDRDEGPFLKEERNLIGAIADIIGRLIHRRETEKALNDSERKYRALVDDLQEGIWVLDENARTTFVNPMMTELTGYPPEDMIGKHLFEFIREEDIDLAKQYLSRRRDGIVEQHPFVFVKRDGQPIHLLVNTSPLIDNEGEYRGAMASMTNLEELLLAEEKLKRSEIRFRSLFNNAGDAIFIQKLDGKRFVEVNQVACDRLGYTREELLEMDANEIESDKTAKLASQRLETIRSNGHLFFETTHIAKDGTAIQTEINSRIIQYDDEKVILHIVRDITERKKAEETIRLATEKLSLLSSITRHDVQNNVTILTAYVSMVLEKIEDESMIEHLKKAMRSCEKIGNQLRKIGEYQTAGTKDPEWIAIKTALRDSIATFDFEGVKLDFNLDEIEIFADPLFDKIFLNLLDNAMKHGKNVSRISLTQERRDGQIVLIMEDDGIGIPEDKKEMIFERGYGEDSGLGLFLVREILHMNGMEIRETGVPGSGARFEISVPQGKYRYGQKT